MRIYNLSLILATLAATLTLSAAARADSFTYTYTGSPFTYLGGYGEPQVFTTSDYVSMSVTLSTALGDSFEGDISQPLSFSASVLDGQGDVVEQLTNLNAPGAEVFFLTGSSGQIQAASVISGNPITSSLYEIAASFTGDDVYWNEQYTCLYSCYESEVDFASNAVGGTWSVADNVSTATTPEPSSLLLAGTGLLGIASLMRRRLLKRRSTTSPWRKSMRLTEGIVFAAIITATCAAPALADPINPLTGFTANMSVDASGANSAQNGVYNSPFYAYSANVSSIGTGSATSSVSLSQGNGNVGLHGSAVSSAPYGSGAFADFNLYYYDTFTIGGTGPQTFQFSLDLDGSATVSGLPANLPPVYDVNDEASGGLYLYVNDSFDDVDGASGPNGCSSYYYYFQQNSCGIAGTDYITSSGATQGTTVTGDVMFEGGTTVQLGLLLQARTFMEYDVNAGPFTGDITSSFLAADTGYMTLTPVTPGASFTTASGLTYAADPDLSVAATPEPSSLLLAGTGLLGIASLMRRRLFKPAAFGIALAAGLVPLQARADSFTYSYTGPTFAYADAPYTTQDFITGSFTVASPLGEDSPLTQISPVAFSFTDGVTTVDTADFASGYIYVATNQYGQIDEWDVELDTPCVGCAVAGYNGIDSYYFGGAYGTDYSIYDDNGSTSQASTLVDGLGQWSATPEPPSLMLLATGLAGSAAVLRRRCRAVN